MWQKNLHSRWGGSVFPAPTSRGHHLKSDGVTNTSASLLGLKQSSHYPPPPKSGNESCCQSRAIVRNEHLGAWRDSSASKNKCLTSKRTWVQPPEPIVLGTHLQSQHWGGEHPWGLIGQLRRLSASILENNPVFDLWPPDTHAPLHTYTH